VKLGASKLYGKFKVKGDLEDELDGTIIGKKCD
jgi:hypothetical protein